MTHSKKNGRTDVNGAPNGEETGMGSFDGHGDAPQSISGAPSFDFGPDELVPFDGTGYELIPLHSPDALDRDGRKIGKAPLKGWRTADPMPVCKAWKHMAEDQRAIGTPFVG